MIRSTPFSSVRRQEKYGNDADVMMKIIRGEIKGLVAEEVSRI